MTFCMKTDLFQKYLPRATLLTAFFLTLSCGAVKNVEIQGYNVGKAVTGGKNLVEGVSTLFDDLNTEDELTIGRATAARVLKRYPQIPKDQGKLQQIYVNLVGKLIASNRRKRSKLPEYHFTVIQSEKRNAYSTPGGYVFITRKLLEFCRSEAELAGILAHEVAHVEAEHLLQEIEAKRQQKGFSQAISGAASLGAAAAKLEDGSEAATDLVKKASDAASRVLFDEGFPPKQELQSDRLAVGLTSRAGYHPMGLVRILQRLQKRKGENQASTTHPPTKKRIQQIKSIIESNDQIDAGGARLKQRLKENVQS